jgi:hypothetical protein
MAARGVAEMMSRISKEEEEDESSSWRKNDRRRLVGDHGALVEALKRENVRG